MTVSTHWTTDGTSPWPRRRECGEVSPGCLGSAWGHSPGCDAGRGPGSSSPSETLSRGRLGSVAGVCRRCWGQGHETQLRGSAGATGPAWGGAPGCSRPASQCGWNNAPHQPEWGELFVPRASTAWFPRWGVTSVVGINKCRTAIRI